MNRTGDELAHWAYERAGFSVASPLNELPGPGRILQGLVGPRNVSYWDRPLEVERHRRFGLIVHLPHGVDDETLTYCLANAAAQVAWMMRWPQVEPDAYVVRIATQVILMPTLAVRAEVARVGFVDRAGLAEAFCTSTCVVHARLQHLRFQPARCRAIPREREVILACVAPTRA